MPGIFASTVIVQALLATLLLRGSCRRLVLVDQEAQEKPRDIDVVFHFQGNFYSTAIGGNSSQPLSWFENVIYVFPFCITQMQILTYVLQSHRASHMVSFPDLIPSHPVSLLFSTDASLWGMRRMEP